MHPTTEQKVVDFLTKLEHVMKNQAMTLATMQGLNEESIRLLHEARRDLTDTTAELSDRILDDDLSGR